jgi:small subunit ribosomal protein S24e
MEFEITKDKRNELLMRRELNFVLRYDGATPSRMQISGKLAALLNTNDKLMVIDSLNTSFGKMELAGNARIYDSEETKLRTERAFLLSRGVPKPKEEAA